MCSEQQQWLRTGIRFDIQTNQSELHVQDDTFFVTQYFDK